MDLKSPAPTPARQGRPLRQLNESDDLHTNKGREGEGSKGPGDALKHMACPWEIVAGG